MDKIKKMWCNLSLRKSIILYISAFVILAILLSAGTATLCNNATKTIESKYPPTGEKYYLTNEISVTGIVLILSAVCKSQMIAFVISAAIHVIPIMLPISETSALYRIIVLMPLFYSQYISIMSVEQMHNGMLYAVWSIPVAIALVVIGSIISHKAFSKHQVR